jgi:hypothetical protein
MVDIRTAISTGSVELAVDRRPLLNLLTGVVLAGLPRAQPFPRKPPVHQA